MIDPSVVGLRGEPFAVQIEVGKVREFARAVRASEPFEESPTIPPTFLTTMFFWQAGVEGADIWPAVGMDPGRGMHAEQEYVFFGPPPRAGDRLVATSRIDRVWEKPSRGGGRLTFVDLVTDFHDETGRLVARARMTAVETEAPPEAP